MADKVESLKAIEQDVQITERTKHAMDDYLTWLQNAMSASPWRNIGPALVEKRPSPQGRAVARRASEGWWAHKDSNLGPAD